MVEGDPTGEHWVAAKRFATLAMHLEPSDRTATALLAEIKARASEAAWHWAPAVDGDAALADVLLQRLPKVSKKGDNFQYLAFARWAVTLCRRISGIRHEATSLASQLPSAALIHCGRAQERCEASIRTRVSWRMRWRRCEHMALLSLP